MTASSNQKKWRTIKSKCDVDSIRTANSDVSVACTTGANDDCSAKRIRRSRFPTDVTKPYTEEMRKKKEIHRILILILILFSFVIVNDDFG